MVKVRKSCQVWPSSHQRSTIPRPLASRSSWLLEYRRPGPRQRRSSLASRDPRRLGRWPCGPSRQFFLSEKRVRNPRGAVSIVGRQCPVDDELSQMILDFLDPGAGGPVENVHQVISVERTLEASKLHLFLQM